MIELYSVDDEYVQYLINFDKRVLSPKIETRKQSRKYVGILHYNGDNKYLIPLSSYKPETYDKMYESKSLKKIGNMAVLRINNMIPVSEDVIHNVVIGSIPDKKYRDLLQSEYKIIKSREREIRTDARIVYFYRLNEKYKGKGLYNICCDFKLLEDALKKYNKANEPDDIK